MSVQTLYTAATGMQSLQTKLNVIANNLANVNTIGFKRGNANFEDLFYRHEKLPGAQDSTGQLTPTGISVGLGSRVSSIQTDYSQGAFRSTNDQLDIAIEGNGFFQVLDPSTGANVYTRAGNFSINSTGQLVLGSAHTGRIVQPSINFPPDATQISISPEGIVEYRQPNNPTLVQAGTIELANFINPEGLLKLGENLFAQTSASGTATQNLPGASGSGLGILRQGAQEASNVEPVEELIDLITTQRSFELNSQAVQAGDQVLQLISNLRRF